MFGKADISAAVVLIGLSVGILLALLSYQRPRGNYPSWGVGIAVLATAAALLSRTFAQPSTASAITLILILVVVMMLLMTYQNRAWAHGIWWIGVVLFLLGLPFLGIGRGDLAVLAIVAGPGLLMLVATLFPEVPARYSKLGVNEPAEVVTEADARVERGRYTRIAGVVLALSLLFVWRSGGVPGASASGPGVAMTVEGLDSLKFKPDTVNVKAGQPVNVTFKNSGNLVHDFVTIGLDQNASIVAVGGGKVQSATFLANKAGTYQYVCNEPGHKEAGMVGKIVVT